MHFESCSRKIAVLSDQSSNARIARIRIMRHARQTSALLIPALAFSLLAADSAAQSAIFDLGTSGLTGTETSVGGAGDVNGDGFDDLLVGSVDSSPGSMDPGTVRVYSGLDGTQLYVFVGSAAGDGFGSSVAGAGDVDGDGFADIIIGAPGVATSDGSAIVISGVSGATLMVFPGTTGAGGQFGFDVDGAGDVNGDGLDDVIVGAPAEYAGGPGIGLARVFSVMAGTTLYTHNGSNVGTPPGVGGLGFSVAGLGDANMDGFADYIVGAAGNGRSEVSVFSGQTGIVLYQVFLNPVSDNFGWAVGAAGDVDNDGFDDFIIGAPSADAGGLTSNGTVTVFSSQAGFVWDTYQGTASSELLGLSVDGVGDIDGDGTVDMLASGLTGNFRVFSGVQLAGTIFSATSAPFASSAGDVNEDGVNDFVVATWSTVEDARVYSGVTNPVVPYANFCNGDGGNQLGCTNCPCVNNAAIGTIGGCLNSVSASARLLATGNRSVSLPSGSNLDLRFALSGSPVGSLCILESGLGIAPTSMSNPCFGLNTGTQSVQFDGLRCAALSILRHGSRTSDSSGDVGVTNNPWGGEGGPPAGVAAAAGIMAGTTRYFQVIYRDTITGGCMRGLNTTQGLEVVFQP